LGSDHEGGRLDNLKRGEHRARTGPAGKSTMPPPGRNGKGKGCTIFPEPNDWPPEVQGIRRPGRKVRKCLERKA